MNIVTFYGQLKRMANEFSRLPDEEAVISVAEFESLTGEDRGHWWIDPADEKQWGVFKKNTLLQERHFPGFALHLLQTLSILEIQKLRLETRYRPETLETWMKDYPENCALHWPDL